jgi:hypothetical protein
MSTKTTQETRTYPVQKWNWRLLRWDPPTPKLVPEAKDNYDPTVPVRLVSGSVNWRQRGTYTLRYESVDSSGNKAIHIVTVFVK